MSTGTQTCEIVLPGYTLTERIGSGGYAEVWRAEAPGGIEKAVKIVYGYYDDEFASQELKALERIKGVRHPFLLSLERFEILNGRLAILTELADMSLDQRLRQCRADGLAGIPRDELLRYMADAAEAIDFLSQRHNLLHLDIKPENLLVLGDHIKVADFGLVKELASKTQNSLVSGMTPTYAAPEIFDDAPSAQSDQYSLAIVYQEMLVGTLPFPGRTAAQLAKQHTLAEPQLASVPAGDRAVLARALAKNPADRFATCKAFVDALLGNAKVPVVVEPAELLCPIPAAPRVSAPNADDTKPPSFSSTLRLSPEAKLEQLNVKVTRPVQHARPTTTAPLAEVSNASRPLLPEETVDIAVPSTNTDLCGLQPTLYLATGGVGIQVLCRLLALTASGDKSVDTNKLSETIAIDTDRDELRQACSSHWSLPLSPDDVLHLPLRLPHSYDNSREILGWVSRRWLYNIPRSLETRGYRPLGRVALVDHSQRVFGLIDKKLAALSNLADVSCAERDVTIRIVLLAGMGGGTGAGMVIDLANAVKSLATTRKLQVEIDGFFVCTCFTNSTSSPLVAANTYSLLTELNHVAVHGNQSTNEKLPLAELFESRESPFDRVYCVPTRSRTPEEPTVDALNTLAEYLALDRLDEARVAIQSCRITPTPREQSRAKVFALRKLGYASLTEQNHKLICALAAELAQAVKQHWATNDASANREELIRDSQQSVTLPKLELVVDSDTPSPTAVLPINEAVSLALRNRFEEHKSLEFSNEVLRQIQCQLDSSDHRGRPRILPCNAKLIVDSARDAAGLLVANMKHEACVPNRFADSSIFRSLVEAGSQRVLRHAIEEFDPAQPERFMPARAMDEIIQNECKALLQESLLQSGVGAAIVGLIDLNKVTSSMLECATTDLLQCGSDRRTLVFVPGDKAEEPVAGELQKMRPLAALIPAKVNDVVVVLEESGISPRSLALGLEHVYPGIADAAYRLHTRIDVDWEKLV